jgi:Cellulose biosynthesis protein BcsS
MGWARTKVGAGGTGAVALVLLALPSAAAGQDDEPDPRSAMFSSVETGASTFVNSGFKWRPDDALDTTGFVLMGSAGAGTLRDRQMREDGLVRLDHLSTQGAVLLGYQWMVERGVWAVFAGAEADVRQPLVDGAILEQTEPAFGARLQAEVWLHPSDRTLLTGTLIAGTARTHLWARGSWGYRIWRDVHVGPEATVALERDYREGRLGLHATGLRLGRFNLRLSGGLLLRQPGEPAGYAALTTDFKL